jgi:hypothetical protein
MSNGEVRRPWHRRRNQIAAAVGVVSAVMAGAVVAGDSDRERSTGGSDRLHDPATTTDTARPGGARAPEKANGGLPGQAPASPRAAAVPTVTDSGSITKDRRTLRVVTAKGDLTGQRELAWAADEGRVVGNARCTQNFRLNPGDPAGVRPTMLLCWRVSETKSVFTVAVDLNGKPSEKESVATIEKAWSSLG